MVRMNTGRPAQGNRAIGRVIIARGGRLSDRKIMARTSAGLVKGERAISRGLLPRVSNQLTNIEWPPPVRKVGMTTWKAI